MTVEGFGIEESGSPPFCPAMGEMHRFFYKISVCGVGRTFVQDHHYVGAKDSLGFDHVFGGEEVARSVEMTLEAGSLFGKGTHPRQREDLITTGIGKDGEIPAHEPVQSTRFAHDLVARPEVEVVGIA